MKPYIVLIFTALIVAFFSGSFVLKTFAPRFASQYQIDEINELKVKMQTSITPYAIVNFSSLYYSDEQFQLLNPSLAIEEFDASLLSSSKGCSNIEILQSQLTGTRKKGVWEQIRCGRIRNIPNWFVKSPPYIHESGVSYAYLLFQYQLATGQASQTSWVRRRLSYFHVSELAQLQREIGPLGGIYGLLASLSQETLQDIINEEGTILAKNFLLARIKYPRQYNVLEYRFYANDSIERFLDQTPYQITRARAGKWCVYNDGPICWRQNTRHLLQTVSTSTLTSFTGIIVIFFIILWLLFSKIKDDKVEESRKKMALQVLTHEFRTPVASLLLIVEKMNRSLGSLPEDQQEDVLRIAGEVYRLQRLTEKSKHYLQGANASGMLTFSYEKLEHLEDLIYDTIIPIKETYDKEIDISIDVNDTIFVDYYWFQILIKNLVENSFIHGAEEHYLKIYEKDKFFVVEVGDGGEITKDLDTLTSEFVKGSKSSGTGLGLNIIKNIVDEWGGKIELVKKPTKFIITLPKRK
ncbi:sensor histidine kinase [Halobacteriovorax sp. ZH4_bin.1]|uniref:sensor histidine kinase n=1 Tax=unclassified Halobacteriovorax TaxID=2639665 RepID=UPI0037209FFC